MGCELFRPQVGLMLTPVDSPPHACQSPCVASAASAVAYLARTDVVHLFLRLWYCVSRFPGNLFVLVLDSAYRVTWSSLLLLCIWRPLLPIPSCTLRAVTLRHVYRAMYIELEPIAFCFLLLDMERLHLKVG